MSHDLSRRELTRRILTGSSAMATLTMNSCNEPRADKAKQKPEAQMVKAVATTPPLQIICHGMMGFNCLTAASPQIIRIYIPNITGHAYKAGANASTLASLHNLTQGAAYKLSPLANNNSLPFSIIRTPNVILQPSAACSCSLNPPGTSPYCTIDIPMPNDYSGFRMAIYSGAGTIFNGTTAAQCGLNLTTIPLVHVFRYTSITSAKLIDPTDPSIVVWDSTAEGAKFHIFAEPTTAMPKGDAHLSAFDTMFSPQLNLHFTDPTKVTYRNDPGDQYVSPAELRSLIEIPAQGPDPTNCMSMFIMS